MYHVFTSLFERGRKLGRRRRGPITTMTTLAVLCMIGVLALLPIGGTLPPTNTPCFDAASCAELSRPCPGTFCGRRDGDTACTHCPPRTRTDGYECLPCNEDPSLYNIFYVVFMFGLVPIINILLVEFKVKERECRLLMEATALVEVLVAAGASVAIFRYGWDSVCRPRTLADWYTPFHNPTAFACASEAVYPLQAMVYVYYGLCIAGLILLRIPASKIILRGKGQISIYVMFWILPILLAINLLFSGLLYYAFPYITLVAVYIGDMVHTSLRSRAEESASGKEKVKIALLFGLRFILGLWAIYCIIVFFSLSNLWFLLLLIGFGVFLCNICIFVCVTSLSQSG
eukprot:gb/GECH01007936.1/.p1 GENE.gb/GECH01007936.1/~~gb/GECH01007936.1/.p1  ORF type:complete len:344 (+),score=12.83 gb/GECH01007936.1/:1-1032(+)